MPENQHQNTANVAAYHRHCAERCTAQGQITEAMRHYLAASAPNLAAGLAERHARAALLCGDVEMLREWFDLLPEEDVWVRPQLLLDRAWFTLLTTPPALPEAVAKTRAGLLALPGVPTAWRDELKALTMIARQVSLTAANTYQDAMNCLDTMTVESHLARGCVALAAALAGGGEPFDAPVLEHAAIAFTEFTSAQFEPGQLHAISVRARLHLHLGNAGAALADCRLALQTQQRQTVPNSGDAATISRLTAEVLFWLNDLEQAQVYLRGTLELALAAGSSAHILFAQSALHLCEVIAGRAVRFAVEEQANELDLWQRMTGTDTCASQSVVVYWQMLRWLAMNNVQAAWRAFAQLGITLDSLPLDAPGAPWLTLLTAYVATGRELDKVETSLNMLLQRDAAGVHYVYYTIQWRLLLVHLYQLQGRRDHAINVLRIVLHEVELTGYTRMVLLRPSLTPLLRAIRTRFAETLADQMAPATTPMTRHEQLTRQEEQVFALLQCGKHIDEIAAELVLSPATIKWHLGNIYAKLRVKGRRDALKLVDHEVGQATHHHKVLL